MTTNYGMDAKVRGYLDRMTGAQQRCGAYGHDWPEIDPDKDKGKLPKGMQAGPIQRDGSFEITENCLRGCGRQRWSVTLPQGYYDLDVQRRYKQRKGFDWVTIPKDVRNETLVSPRVFQADLQEQYRDVLVAAARRAAEAMQQEAEQAVMSDVAAEQAMAHGRQAS